MNSGEFSTKVDFSALVSGLMAEGMVSMGLLEHPSMKGIKKDVKHAQAVIDTLGMLKEKTQGNLTEQESKMLEEVLHQLRIGYVSFVKNENSKLNEDKKTGGAS
jgi:hypothetical protein